MTSNLVPGFPIPGLQVEMTALVRGERPQHLTWVDRYRTHGDTLTESPDDIWTHPHARAGRTAAGGWWVDVPLWTTGEHSSDLTARFDVSAEGKVCLHDVHVM